MLTKLRITSYEHLLNEGSFWMFVHIDYLFLIKFYSLRGSVGFSNGSRSKSNMPQGIDPAAHLVQARQVVRWCHDP
jgi:hypothetical protein